MTECVGTRQEYSIHDIKQTYATAHISRSSLTIIIYVSTWCSNSYGSYNLPFIKWHMILMTLVEWLYDVDNRFRSRILARPGNGSGYSDNTFCYRSRIPTRAANRSGYSSNTFCNRSRIPARAANRSRNSGNPFY